MLDKIRDRGMQKWTGLMLTEHVGMLKDFQVEYESAERPEFDEWELTLLAEEIERAHKGKNTVKLTYWKDGKLLDDYGKIITIDNASNSIVLDDPFSTIRYQFADIVAVTVIE